MTSRHSVSRKRSLKRCSSAAADAWRSNDRSVASSTIAALLECSTTQRDLENRTERRTDATDRAVEYRYDTRGNVVTIVDGLENEIRFEYDAKDRMTAMVDPVGARTTWTYDATGDLLQQVSPHEEGEAPADYATNMTYNNRGDLTSIVRPGGVRWSFGRDVAGHLTEIRDGDEAQRFFARYSNRGALVAEGNRFGETTFLDLQAFGEPRRVVDPFGAELLVEYDAAGRVKKLTDGTEISQFTLDASGEETRADYGGGFWHETDYDGLGRWSRQRSPLFGELARDLDATGRPAGWRYEDGPAIGYSRDAAGRLLISTDPAGRQTQNDYDAAGRLVRTVAPGGGETSSSWMPRVEPSRPSTL
jgi:YD repeat-containing protein